MVHMLAKNPKSRVLTGILATLLALTGITVTMSPAQAVGIGIEDGAGSDGTGVGGGGGNSGGNTGGGGGGNSGGGGYVDPYAPYWQTTWGGNPYCANKIGVGASIGVSLQFQKQTLASFDLPAGGGWIDTGTYVAGYGNIWERTIYTGNQQCHYPPRYELVTQQCILSTTATITQKRPSVVSLGTKTNMSGYTLGNPSPDACKNSKSNAGINTSINRYSLVEAVAVSKAVNQTFKIYTEADPRTGSIPAPELQGQGIPFNLSPKTASISVSCKGVSNPANYALSDFTDNLCNPANNPGSSTYQCNVSPVVYNMANSGASADMKSFPNNSVQFMASQMGNPGVDMVFKQTVSGKGITVNQNGFKTSYSTNIPFTEMDIKSTSGSVTNKNVLTGKKQASANFAGQKNNVNVVYNGATDPDQNMKLTQTLEWSGTRAVSMPTIDSIDPISGKINISYKTVNVPTSGKCSSTADVQVLRAIGDNIS